MIIHILIPGWLYHVLGSYHSAFYVAGAVAVLSSLLIFAVPCLVNREARYKADHPDCPSCHKKQHNKKLSLETSSLEQQPILEVDEFHKLCQRHKRIVTRLAEMTVVIDKETVL